jgi:DNA-binding IclR family transcriptional regulator
MPGEAVRGKSVISKAISVLEAFSTSASQLSLKQLAESTGLPQSTAYRLATELVAWGGLERVQGGGYRIGFRLVEIAAPAMRRESLRDVALPLMQDLFNATHENVHLAILDGTEALYVETITGRDSASLVSKSSERLPLHATGVGKVLLAFGPDELLADVLASGLTRYTAYTIMLPVQLRRTVVKVRCDGVAFAHEELSIGSGSVAAPVMASPGRAVAALTVDLRANQSDLERLAPAVQATTNSLSRILQRLSADPPPRDRTGRRP